MFPPRPVCPDCGQLTHKEITTDKPQGNIFESTGMIASTKVSASLPTAVSTFSK